jgi:hypothetical protein
MATNGQLLIVRRHVALAIGATTLDTGITQVNLGVDPPLGGSVTIASRVMVVPMSPYVNWTSVTHGEPYLSGGTIHVDFDNESGLIAPVNIMFLAPSTFIGPIDVDLYTIAPPACATPTVVTLDNLAVSPPSFGL